MYIKKSRPWMNFYSFFSRQGKKENFVLETPPVLPVYNLIRARLHTSKSFQSRMCRLFRAASKRLHEPALISVLISFSGAG